MALDNLITMVKYIFVYDNFKDPKIRILVTTNVLMLNVAIYIAHILIIICLLVLKNGLKIRFNELLIITVDS